MKTLSAVSTKVSVLSGRPVIQVTNVTVYGVIVNPYRFIDPTSVFFSASLGSAEPLTFYADHAS